MISSSQFLGSIYDEIRPKPAHYGFYVISKAVPSEAMFVCYTYRLIKSYNPKLS